MMNLFFTLLFSVNIWITAARAEICARILTGTQTIDPTQALTDYINMAANLEEARLMSTMPTATIKTGEIELAQKENELRKIFGNEEFEKKIAASKTAVNKNYDLQTAKNESTKAQSKLDEVNRFAPWRERVKLRKLHSDLVYKADFSPDGQYVVTASSDKTIIIWDAKTSKKIKKIGSGHTNAIHSAKYSPNGEFIVTASADGTAIIWNPNTGRKIKIFENAHSNGFYYAEFSPDGQSIITASADRSALIWDIKTGQVIQKLKGHRAEVYSAVFSHDGQRILTASGDKTAVLWDLKTGKKITTFNKKHTDAVFSAAFSPDEKYIVTASNDGTAIIWNAKTGKKRKTFTHYPSPDLSLSMHPPSVAVNTAVFSPDGLFILTASDNETAVIWNIQTGRAHNLLNHARQVPHRTNYVLSATFSPDGHTIITTTAHDCIAIIWERDLSGLEDSL